MGVPPEFSFHTPPSTLKNVLWSVLRMNNPLLFNEDDFHDHYISLVYDLFKLLYPERVPDLIFSLKICILQ